MTHAPWPGFHSELTQLWHWLTGSIRAKSYCSIRDRARDSGVSLGVILQSRLASGLMVELMIHFGLGLILVKNRFSCYIILNIHVESTIRIGVRVWAKEGVWCDLCSGVADRSVIRVNFKFWFSDGFGLHVGICIPLVTRWPHHHLTEWTFTWCMWWRKKKKTGPQKQRERSN